MHLPFTEHISDYISGDDEDKRVDPDEDDIAAQIQAGGADKIDAQRLAQHFSDLILYARQVGRQEAELGKDDEDNSVLYAVLAAALISAANAAMLLHVHFMA